MPALAFRTDEKSVRHREYIRARRKAKAETLAAKMRPDGCFYYPPQDMPACFRLRSSLRLWQEKGHLVFLAVDVVSKPRVRKTEKLLAYAAGG